MNEELIKRIEDLERRVTVLEQPSDEPTGIPQDRKPLSLREFIISKSPKTSLDTTLLIGYYLEKYSLTPSFNIDDIVKGFNQAKEKPPSNPSDMLAKNARRGFIMEAEDKKNGVKGWMITNSGEQFIENGLKETPSE
jgi:hypothetical protein